MLRPESALRPLVPTMATAPAAPAGGGHGFNALLAQVQGDVQDFIERGGAASPLPPVAVLSPEGQRVRNAMAAGAERAGGPAAFVADVAPDAEDAARRLGVAPELVVAHAALESGWGRKPLLQADGRSTHNLFGIKAMGGWQGEVSEARTTEFQDGVPVARTERFRSYPDQAAAFRDYAQLLLDNPRYRGALNTGSDARAFAEGLARGGYATDPDYAAKLAGVAQRLAGREGAR